MAQVMTGNSGRTFQNKEEGPDVELRTGSGTFTAGTREYDGAAEILAGVRYEMASLQRLRDALTLPESANLDGAEIDRRKAVVDNELLVRALGEERAGTYRDRVASEFYKIEEFIERDGSVWGFSEAGLMQAFHPEFRIPRDGLFIHFHLTSPADHENNSIEIMLAEEEGRMPSMSTPRGGSVWGYFSREAITDGTLDQFLSDVDQIAARLRFALPHDSHKLTLHALDMMGLAMPKDGDIVQAEGVTALRDLVVNMVNQMLAESENLELPSIHDGNEFSPDYPGFVWHGSQYHDAQRYKD